MNESRIEVDCQARQAEIQALLDELAQRVREPQVVSNGEEWEALERSIVALTDRLAGEVIGVQIQASLASEELAQEEAALAKRCGRKRRADGSRRCGFAPCAVRRWRSGRMITEPGAGGWVSAPGGCIRA